MSFLHVMLYATEVEYYWMRGRKKNYARFMVTCMTKTDPVLAFRRRWQTLNSFRPLTPYHQFNRLMFWRSARTSSALLLFLSSTKRIYNDNKREKQ